MTRIEMLKKLYTVKFEYIYPESDWKDIGFTERDIWVNSKGYGYLSCDEPNGAWNGPGLSEDKWKQIKHKLMTSELSIDDIKSTPLFEPFESFYGFDDDNEEYLMMCQTLQELFELNPLPNEKQRLYCVQGWDKLLFFNNEEEFLRAYERDNCDYLWNDLSNDALEEWIKRLF